MSNDVTAVSNLIVIINNSRQNSFLKVNEELVQMYGIVGEYLSSETKNKSFGDAYINKIKRDIQNTFPRIKTSI